MSNVDTQKEAFTTVTQVVYETVFEGTQMFREISEKQAEKRRAEEAAREEAARQEAARKSTPDSSLSQSSPSVIVDIKSASTDTAAPPATAPATSSNPVQHTVNVIA